MRSCARRRRPTRRLYFSGDTGYFAGFKEIGAGLGPFDLAAIAIGAYLPTAMMRPVHMDPEEAVQAFVASYTEEVNRQRDTALGQRRGVEAKLAQLERKLQGLYDAIA